MKLTELTAIGLRIFAVYLFIYALNQSTLLFNFIGSQPNDGDIGIALPLYIFWVGTPLLISIIIWFFPITTTKLFLPKYNTDTLSSITKSEIYIAAIVLVGIIILSTAIPDILYWATRLYIRTGFEESSAAITLSAPNDVALIVSTITRFFIGIWLLFGAKGLLGFLIKARS